MVLHLCPPSEVVISSLSFQLCQANFYSCTKSYVYKTFRDQLQLVNHKIVGQKQYEDGGPNDPLVSFEFMSSSTSQDQGHHASQEATNYARWLLKGTKFQIIKGPSNLNTKITEKQVIDAFLAWNTEGRNTKEIQLVNFGNANYVYGSTDASKPPIIRKHYNKKASASQDSYSIFFAFQQKKKSLASQHKETRIVPVIPTKEETKKRLLEETDDSVTRVFKQCNDSKCTRPASPEIYCYYHWTCHYYTLLCSFVDTLKTNGELSVIIRPPGYEDATKCLLPSCNESVRLHMGYCKPHFVGCALIFLGEMQSHGLVNKLIDLSLPELSNTGTVPTCTIRSKKGNGVVRCTREQMGAGRCVEHLKAYYYDVFKDFLSRWLDHTVCNKRCFCGRSCIKSYFCSVHIPKESVLLERLIANLGSRAGLETLGNMSIEELEDEQTDPQ